MHGDQLVVVFRDEFRSDAVEYLAAEAAEHSHLPVTGANRSEEAPFAEPSSDGPTAHHQGGPHRCSPCGRIDDPAADLQAVIAREPHFFQSRFELTPRNQPPN
jgi:hypothetical protein